MALARTTVHGSVSGDGHGTGAFVTSSFTPPDASLLCVAVGLMEDSGSTDATPDLTIAGGGLTFTSRRTTFTGPAWAISAAIYTAPVATGASMAFTLDCAARNVYFYAVSAVAYTGYDTSTPVGGTGAAVDNATPDGAHSLTLSSAPAADSEVFALIALDKEDIGTTPGAAFTEIHDFQVTAAGGMETEVRTGSTSTTVDWVDTHTGTGSIFKVCAAAIEVKAVGGAPSMTSVFLRPTQAARLITR